MPDRVLSMGMVGGGLDAFIGAVHRTAACMDHGARFVAGCLSSTPEKALASGRALALGEDRNYATWQAMLDGELRRAPTDRIDFVSIVTPNHVHFPVALAFAKAGIHVVCDKPLVHTTAQARELCEVVRRSPRLVFAVTYNYSGYPMVKQARAMVRRGDIGRVRKVVVEYNQGWLSGGLELTGQKQADWRTDPARSGLGGAIGDIGSHAEQLTSYITGLEIESMCAELSTFVAGRKLDDDANVLIRFRSTASDPTPKGVLIASQVEIGHENDLRIRIFGESGSLEWRQEDPNALIHRPEGKPELILKRGNAYLVDEARRNSRLPPGHPEAFLEAFANVYSSAFAAMRAGKGGLTAPDEFDFPGVIDGARGVHFIESVVTSACSERKWTDVSFKI